MIESLTYTPKTKSSMPWAGELELFKANPTLTFKPGLNIIYGPNGSGKSTALQMMGLHLAATQGGVSTVTQSWVNDVLGLLEKETNLPCSVVHDGAPIMYFDARAKEGLIGGSFDDDFFSLGLANTMAKGSTGQLGFARMGRMIEVLLSKDEPGQPEEVAAKPKKTTTKAATPPPETKPSGFPRKIVWKMSKNSVNTTWGERLDIAGKLLEAKCPVGPKTMLFDEPESGFSLPWQAGLWRNCFEKVDPEKFQLIIATHSPFALGIPGANYIETSPGYAKQSFDALWRAMTEKAKAF